MDVHIVHGRFADDRSGVVYAKAGAVLAAERSEVVHGPVRIKECVQLIVGERRLARYLTEIIQRERSAVSATERSQVQHCAVGVKKSVSRGVVGSQRKAGALTGIID